MSRRHGRAVIPFGKYKGVHVRNIPDDYLSWLLNWGEHWLGNDKWRWLTESIVAELHHRGLVAQIPARTEFRKLMDELFGDKVEVEAVHVERKVRKQDEF